MATPLTVAGAVIAPGIGPGEKALEFTPPFAVHTSIKVLTVAPL